MFQFLVSPDLAAGSAGSGMFLNWWILLHRRHGHGFYRGRSDYLIHRPTASPCQRGTTTTLPSGVHHARVLAGDYRDTFTHQQRHGLDSGHCLEIPHPLAFTSTIVVHNDERTLGVSARLMLGTRKLSARSVLHQHQRCWGAVPLEFTPCYIAENNPCTCICLHEGE